MRVTRIIATVAYTTFLLFWTVRTADAGYLTSGTAFVDGQTVKASDLNNAINNAIIGPGFISTQPINSSPQITDYLIEYSPTLNNLYKIQLSAVFNTSQQWLTLSSGYPNINTNDLFQFFNQALQVPQTISYTNLISSISSNLLVQYFNFAPTNNNNGATNFPALPTAGVWQPGSTNQQPFVLAFTNNGVPYQFAFSNLVDLASPMIGTNLIAWDFEQAFQPWLILGTNPFVPYTNGLGYTTNLPITSFTMTTANSGSSNTLFDSDTIPILSHAMGANGSGNATNTTASLLAIYQYLTNKNTLPPYTTAREQFNGTAVSLVVCNTPSSGYIGPSGNFNVIAVTTNTITFNPLITNNIFAFTLITNGNTMFQGSGGVDTTNQLYWGVPFLTSTWLLPTNVMFVNVYTNYVSAAANGISQNGAQTYSANFGIGNKILIVTNLTSFNGDVAPATTPGTPPTVETGVYLFGFRTNSATSLFYTSGSTVGLDDAVTPHPGGIITLSGLGYPGTSQFQFGAYDAVAGLYHQFPIVQVLVQPQ